VVGRQGRIIYVILIAVYVAGVLLLF